MLKLKLRTAKLGLFIAMQPRRITGFEFLVKYEAQIRHLAVQSCRQRYDLIDELWAEAVDRTPRIVEILWDGQRDLWTYVRGNLRWYFFKKLNANMSRYEKQEPLYERGVSPDSDRETTDQVHTIMARLSCYDQRLLQMHDGEGRSFGDMAIILGIAKGTVHSRYHTALKHARAVVEEMR
jgi:DNA-directed RNA polymerase specialized sigma24 family protein